MSQQSKNEEKDARGIKEGPGKWDLLTCLGDKEKRVWFTVSIPSSGAGGLRHSGRCKVKITALEEEGRGGETWNIKGWVAHDSHNAGKWFTGRYDSRIRVGTIVFFDGDVPPPDRKPHDD